MTSRPRKERRLPSERGDANSTRSSSGKLRSSRSLRVVRPTAPVAPTTATRMCPSYEPRPAPPGGPLLVPPDPPSVLAQPELRVHGAHSPLGVSRPDHAG